MLIFQRDVAPIRFWLQVYITLFIVDALGMFIIFTVWMFNDTYNLDPYKRQFILNTFFYGLIIEGINETYD